MSAEPWTSDDVEDLVGALVRERLVEYLELDSEAAWTHLDAAEVAESAGEQMAERLQRRGVIA